MGDDGGGAGLSATAGGDAVRLGGTAQPAKKAVVKSKDPNHSPLPEANSEWPWRSSLSRGTDNGAGFWHKE